MSKADAIMCLLEPVCHTKDMGKALSKNVLALEYLKAASSHKHNRCDNCGRRLKLHPGGLILLAPRFTTCRSCGFDNPSLLEKVAETLSAAGYDIAFDGGYSELPQCLNCGVELQVSRDFTKVFCRTCGREWSVPDFEDIMGGPLAAKLAGVLPIRPDESKLAKELLAFLDEQNLDYSTPYLVLPLAFKVEIQPGAKSGSRAETKSFFKIFSDGFKEGLADSKPKAKVAKTPKDVVYLAIFEEYLGKYSSINGAVKVEEAQFSELFKQNQDSIDPGFEITFLNKRSQSEYNSLLNELRTIFLAHQSPYQEVLFGKAKAEVKRSLQAQVQGESIAEQIQKLADLRNQGLLTESEFTAAKAKLLQA